MNPSTPLTPERFQQAKLGLQQLIDEHTMGLVFDGLVSICHDLAVTSLSLRWKTKYTTAGDHLLRVRYWLGLPGFFEQEENDDD